MDDLQSIKLVFPGEILAHQSVRKSRGGAFYQPKKVQKYKDRIRLDAISQLTLKFTAWKEVVIIDELTFIFPPIESLKAVDHAKIASGEIVYKQTKPDLTDNLQKAFIDALSGVLFKDDNIIVEENCVRKVYGHRPGIILRARGK